MKMTSAFLACLLSALTVYSQGTIAQKDQAARLQSKDDEATQLMARKDYKKAITVFRDILKNPALQNYQTSKPGILYNLACCYSLLGDKSNAVSALRSAVEEGYSSLDHMQKDTDLDGIRTESGYQEIAALLKEQESRWGLAPFRTPFRANISNQEKVAGLSLIWSEVKHSFANFFNVPNLNWDSLYLAFLPKAEETGSTVEYYRVLQELTAKLKDGHTSVYPPSEIRQQFFGVPLEAALIEGKVVVTAVKSDSLRRTGIIPGLEITRIEGTPARQYAEEQVAPYQSASTEQDLISRTFVSLFRSLSPTPVALEFVDGQGHALTRTIERVPFRYPRFPVVEFRALPEAVAYVALNTFNEQSAVKQFDSLFAQIKGSRALIIDIRNNGGGNSSIGWDILTYLTDQPFETSRWRTREHRAVYRAWGLGERWYGEPGALYAVRKGEPYRKPVVVLTSPRTYSAAEDFAVVFDALKRGTIMGEPTGGSTGQPLMFPLPGGGEVRICAKHDEYPDGRGFVGVGIQPGIRVEPTIADVRAGRDTVLEAALKFLAGKGQGQQP